MTIDDISEEIKKADSIVILTHESPDGDAVGSSLALYIALNQLGKKADVIIPGCPKVYDFLPCVEAIRNEGSNEKYDLAIALDCADIKRIGDVVHYFEEAKVTISIDHHESNNMYGDYNFVNPAAPACAQILVGIFEGIGIEINKEIGVCILTGIITDTGGFKYSSVTAETFEFTSWLLNKGVNVADIYKQVLQVKTRPNFELSKIVSERLEFLEEGKITFTYITKKDEEDVKANIGDHEGLVEIARDIEGVEVAILLRETDKGYKASLRSNGKINVSEAVTIFGGGGHPKAAGCTLPANLEVAKEKIVNQIKTYLQNSN